MRLIDEILVVFRFTVSVTLIVETIIVYRQIQLAKERSMVIVAEQRTKEIGVRKVLGASVFNLWNLLSKDFVRLTIISLFVAIPLLITL